jgi:hypothetical protein
MLVWRVMAYTAIGCEKMEEEAEPHPSETSTSPLDFIEAKPMIREHSDGG